jgi:hypothetical protein
MIDNSFQANAKAANGTAPFGEEQQCWTWGAVIGD